MQPGVFAICLKENPEPIGAISIQKYGNPEDQEGELGYWLGEPFWGSEIMVEACRALIDYAFETGYRRIWCGHFRENEQSKRVIEKCGFMHHHTNENVSWKLRNQVVTQELYVLKADDWMKLQG